jgi:hypothetical protein
MSKVVLDEALRSKLNGLNAEVELCDETGRTVGRFLPEDVYWEFAYAWAKAQFTDEELAEARAEPGGMTTPEAIAYIERFIQSRERPS